jgi:hypothetical protein
VGLQETIALSIVALTAGMFLRGRFRPRRFSFQRHTHCGCSSPGESIDQPSIVFQARKGERSRVVVKMKSKQMLAQPAKVI